MTSLMHFEEKVHRKGLVRAESLMLLMPRLLCQVLEHLGFSGGAQDLEEDLMPSSPVVGASDDHARIFPPPAAGPGGGAGSGGRGLPQR